MHGQSGMERLLKKFKQPKFFWDWDRPAAYDMWRPVMATILKKEEIEKLEHLTRMNPCGLMIKLIVRMGLRHGEALELRVDDIDANGHRLMVRGTNPRFVAVPEETRLPIMRAIHGRDSDAFVISNSPDGMRPLGARTFQAFLGRTARMMNLCDLNAKNLRSTYIVRRLEAGIDPRLIQAELGIRSLKSVTKYRDLARDPFTLAHAAEFINEGLHATG